MRASPLARILFPVYAPLVLYAIAVPVGGLARSGRLALRLSDRAVAALCHRFDMVVNVLGYIPYGFLAAARRASRARDCRVFGRHRSALFLR